MYRIIEIPIKIQGRIAFFNPAFLQGWNGVQFTPAYEKKSLSRGEVVLIIDSSTCGRMIVRSHFAL